MISNITYYDFTNLNYAGFFLNGFIANSKKYGYQFRVSRKTPEVVREIAARENSPLSLYAAGLFSAEVNGQNKLFCIDMADSRQVYILPLLAKTELYFKVNYDEPTVKADPKLLPHISKITPLPLFFPISLPKRWLFRPRLMPCRHTGWGANDINRRLRILKGLVPLSKILSLRNSPKEIDIFFVLTYYGEEIHARTEDFRARLINEIKRHKNLKAITGFNHPTPLTGHLAGLQCRRYRLEEYLRNMARARVAIYVRGMHDCISFKLGQLLALGLPVAGQPIANNKDIFYATDCFSEQFSYEQPEEIVQQALNLLAHPELQKKYGAANARAFDEKFNPQAVTARIIERLSTC